MSSTNLFAPRVPSTKRLTREHWPFRGHQRDRHYHEQWDRCETRQQAKQNQGAAENLERANEWPEQFRQRQADFQEAPSPQLVGKQELLDSLREKHGTPDQAAQRDGCKEPCCERLVATLGFLACIVC